MVAVMTVSNARCRGAMFTLFFAPMKWAENWISCSGIEWMWQTSQSHELSSSNQITICFNRSLWWCARLAIGNWFDSRCCRRTLMTRSGSRQNSLRTDLVTFFPISFFFAFGHKQLRTLSSKPKTSYQQTSEKCVCTILWMLFFRLEVL